MWLLTPFNPDDEDEHGQSVITTQSRHQAALSMISGRQRSKESERPSSKEGEGPGGVRGGEGEGQENSRARTPEADSPCRLQRDSDMENSPRLATRQKSSSTACPCTCDIITGKRDSILEEPDEVFVFNGEILLEYKSTERECIGMEYQLQTETTDSGGSEM